MKSGVRAYLTGKTVRCRGRCSCRLAGCDVTGSCFAFGRMGFSEGDVVSRVSFFFHRGGAKGATGRIFDFVARCFYRQCPRVGAGAVSGRGGNRSFSNECERGKVVGV